MTTNSVNAKCESFKVNSPKLPHLKQHIYISKEATFALAKYIKYENWGRNNWRLYNYLDYMWRLQLIDNNVKIFKYKDQQRLVFNTGLYSRNKNKIVYLVLVQNILSCNNYERKCIQEWRVACHKGNGKNVSFSTKKELICKYRLNINYSKI